MKNDSNNKNGELNNPKLFIEAFQLVHQVLKSAQEGDRKARLAIKKNKACFLRIQNTYKEFKHYKI